VTGSSGMARKRTRMREPGHDIEVLEKNTDTSWAAFQALRDEHEQSYKVTEPAVLPAPATGAGGALSVDDVMQEVRRNNRLCPKPLVWQRLYEWLPHKPPQLPSVPATRADWDQMSPMQKRSRLREHIEWAAVQGVLHKVHEAFKALPEERWYHIGE
jgi:hypothetical protein